MRAALSPSEVFGRGLEHGRLFALREDGSRLPLATQRWLGPLDEIDARVLDRAAGPVLDIGCGPGRHVVALSDRGVAAIGVDVAPAAVRQARDRGAAVILGSIFDPIPGPSTWRTALLLDGNIGIGGRPVALLRRLGELLCHDGEVLCELDPPGTPSRCELIALEDAGGSRSSWFAWARVAVDEVEAICSRSGFGSRSGFVTAERWQDGNRWFARLARVSAAPPALAAGGQGGRS